MEVNLKKHIFYLIDQLAAFLPLDDIAITSDGSYFAGVSFYQHIRSIRVGVFERVIKKPERPANAHDLGQASETLSLFAPERSTAYKLEDRAPGSESDLDVLRRGYARLAKGLYVHARKNDAFCNFLGYIGAETTFQLLSKRMSRAFGTSSSNLSDKVAELQDICNGVEAAYVRWNANENNNTDTDTSIDTRIDTCFSLVQSGQPW